MMGWLPSIFQLKVRHLRKYPVKFCLGLLLICQTLSYSLLSSKVLRRESNAGEQGCGLRILPIIKARLLLHQTDDIMSLHKCWTK